MSWLVFGGATGWVGGMLVDLLREQGKIVAIIICSVFSLLLDVGETVHCARARLENREAIERDIDEVLTVCA